MPIDESPKTHPSRSLDGAGGRPAEAIVSVNDVGRRQSDRAGPFLVMGGIAAVVLIGGLLTVNVIRSKLSGPKPLVASPTASAAGLSKSFDTDDQPPPLPGSAAASESGAAAGAAPACSDGSAGNELRGRDDVVVRNAEGEGVRVCPNGQVVGTMTSAAPSTRPIPVQPTSGRGMASSASTVRSTGMAVAPVGQMMLNDGKYGAAPLVPDPGNPQSVLGSIAQAATEVQPKTEGLLTSAPQGSMEAELIPSKTPLVQAARIGDLNLLLPKGHTIDCGMSMRIISTLAGQASCVVTSSVYSANGKVVLIERGSEAVGEYRSGVSVGQRRLFVLWDRIITPSGVVINLDSPGADELGSTGLTGKVDNHWFERIGSAFLLSTIQDALQYEITEEQSKNGSGTLVLSNTAQTSDSMAQKVLEATINIPPTIYKNQGDRAVIYVARDLDFSNVYRLRPR